MFATFSDENIVDQHMRELGLPFSFLAAVSGTCSSPTLHGWLDGSARLDPVKSQKLVATCRALKRIRDEAAPLPLEFRNVGLWKMLLEKYAERAARQQSATQSETGVEKDLQ
jgi:hypothetical protein